MAADATVILLAERRDLIPRVAQLLSETWPDYYGEDGPGFAQRDATDRARADGLPMAVIALDAASDVIGAGTLADRSFGAKDAEGPWITGLCVTPAARGKGVATEIVGALCRLCSAHGYVQVYAATIAAEGLLERCGFRTLRMVNDATGAWCVMSADLTQEKRPA